MKKTVVLGATPNPARYANMATRKLKTFGHEVIPVGIRKGEIDGIEIRNFPNVEDVDTITLYLGARHQQEHYEYILNLNPKRIIFNPGTENPELENLAAQKGIETTHDCTLVMLSVGTY